ncbi:MAG: alanine racemase, partial [Clostridia bacterium]|nr:alanine racemase [Clostridia bacterium]
MTEKSYNEMRFADISENIKVIRENVAVCAEKSGRKPEDIKIMAVTKTVDPVFINHAIDNCGIDLIGENRVQEYFSKKDDLHLENCSVHLIGHLQTKKVKQIVPEVEMIQSVDSLKLAEEIGKVSSKLSKKTNVLIEVNIGNEDSKFGIDKSELSEFVYSLSEIDGIKVKGM